jgi:hypothetical protein
MLAALDNVRMGCVGYSVVMSYQPMSLAGLARLIALEPDFDTRWRLVVEFLKEYHREPDGTRQRLLADVPEPVGDQRWDALFAGLAEHLAMRDGKDAAVWAASRGLRLLVSVRHARLARPGTGACPGRVAQTRRVRRRLRDRCRVSDSSPLLDRSGSEEAFRHLGERLERRGVVTDLYVFGGAAMALAYDSRRATRDVDALFKPHGIVLDEALAVAAELGLPRWWLNEQASSYVAPTGDSAASRVFDHRDSASLLLRPSTFWP